MSRSLHTQQWQARAERRLSRPYSKRREEAGYLSGRRSDEAEPQSWLHRLRIQPQKPVPGMRHLLEPTDIRDFLALLGPSSIYRLKSLRLGSESAVRTEGIVFAEYVVGGEIRLYAVPEGPWRLPFLLAAEDRAVFARYGARVEVDWEREQTTVRWSTGGMKRFALQEVLAHEMGHHLLQNRKGKRTVLSARRIDHEKRADLQSRRFGRLLRRGGAHA